MGRLLEKFNIQLYQLSYEFIKSCSNKKTLQHIIKILSSGEEGIFPHLEKKAKERLRLFAPDSVLLREEVTACKKRDLPDDVWKQLEGELMDWTSEIKRQETVISTLSKPANDNLPAIRKNTVQKPQVEAKSPSTKDAVNRKIKRDDYDKWDKYDPDLEIMKMNVSEEKKIEEEMKIRLEQEKKENNIDLKLDVQNTPSNAELSDSQRDDLAEKARVKGNEYYKASDLPLALAFYNESINYKPTCAACNNRALTYIKLKRYAEARADCDYVLESEPENTKALYRRALCYKNTGDLHSALIDLEEAVTLEPKDKGIENEYREIRKKLKLPEPPSRSKIKIEEAPVGPFPVLYYGASTSSFACYPSSATHFMLTGSRSITKYVPCKCSRSAPKQNPLCGFCGDRMLKIIQNKATLKRKSGEPFLDAYEVRKLCRKRNTHFIVSPPKIQKMGRVASMVQALPPPSAPKLPTSVTAINERTLEKSDQNVDQTKTPNVVQTTVKAPIIMDSNRLEEERMANISQSALNVEAAPGTPNKATTVTCCAKCPKSKEKLRKLEERLNKAEKMLVKAALADDPSRPNKTIDSVKGQRGSVRNKQMGKPKGPEGTKADEEMRMRQLAEDAKRRGDAMSQSKMYPLSLRYYTTSIKLHPQVSTLIARANDFIQMQNYTDAVEDCSQALLMEPTNVQALLKRATAYVKMEKDKFWKLGLFDLEAAVKLNPTDPSIQRDANSLMEQILGCTNCTSKRLQLKGHRAAVYPAQRTPQVANKAAGETLRDNKEINGEVPEIPNVDGTGDKASSSASIQGKINVRSTTDYLNTIANKPLQSVNRKEAVDGPCRPLLNGNGLVGAKRNKQEAVLNSTQHS